MSIRIDQSETLDSEKCHTFPGWEVELCQFSCTIQIFNFFVPKVSIEIPAHANSFIMIPARLVRAWALAYFDAWLNAVLGQHSWLLQAARGGLTGCWPTYPPKLCWYRPRKTRLVCHCQLHNNRPPFKSQLALPPSSRSAQILQRIQGQGLLHCWYLLRRNPCWSWITMLAQCLRQVDSLHKMVSSNLDPSNFLLCVQCT